MYRIYTDQDIYETTTYDKACALMDKLELRGEQVISYEDFASDEELEEELYNMCHSYEEE